MVHPKGFVTVAGGKKLGQPFDRDEENAIVRCLVLSALSVPMLFI